MYIFIHTHIHIYIISSLTFLHTIIFIVLESLKQKLAADYASVAWMLVTMTVCSLSRSLSRYDRTGGSVPLVMSVQPETGPVHVII